MINDKIMEEESMKPMFLENPYVTIFLGESQESIKTIELQEIFFVTSHSVIDAKSIFIFVNELNLYQHKIVDNSLLNQE